MQKGDIANDCF